MLCVPIVGPSWVDVERQVQMALKQADLLEFRIDLFRGVDARQLEKLRHSSKLPIIFAHRKESQGGGFEGSEEKRLSEIKRLAKFLPDYFDLEYDIPLPFLESFKKEFPQVKTIISYHNFSETPLDLEGLLKQMKSLPGNVYKLACMAHSSLDSLRMLHFIEQNRPLVGVCMGYKGGITRILGPCKGSLWSYASLTQDLKSAPGQIDCEPLRSVYPIDKFTEAGGIYGMIGGSLHSSFSHFIHNALMRELKLDAVYLLIELQKMELKEFFLSAEQMGIRGLSVTIPFKEDVMPFIDEIDPKAQWMGAVNTIVFRDGKKRGSNTDGSGALDAIEKKIKVQGKRVVVLGAGGTGRAIAFEAVQRGADVLILNRTHDKAAKLAEAFGAEGGGLERLIKERNYDVLINTTPEGLPIPIEAISPKSVMMDVSFFPKKSRLLQQAEKKQCTLVFGYEMWIHQAVSQYRAWLPHLDPKLVQSVLSSDVVRRVSNPLLENKA